MLHPTVIQKYLIAITVSFLCGLAVGYLLWHRNNDRKLSSIQIVSIGVFFGYLGFSFAVGREPSDLVSTTILAGIGGEALGKALKDRFSK